MVKTFSVNENNDLYIDESGNLAVISGIDAVLQLCAQAAKTLRGELIFETENGIPLFQTVFNGVPNLLQFEAALRKSWRNISGVKDILTLDIEIKNNILSYNATILTEFGQGIIDDEL